MLLSQPLTHVININSWIIWNLYLCVTTKEKFTGVVKHNIFGRNGNAFEIFVFVTNSHDVHAQFMLRFYPAMKTYFIFCSMEERCVETLNRILLRVYRNFYKSYFQETVEKSGGVAHIKKEGWWILSCEKLNHRQNTFLSFFHFTATSTLDLECTSHRHRN